MSDRYLATRLHGLGVSVFAEMSALAFHHQAVNLGQGFPDFPGPDFVKDAAQQAIAADHNQYAHPNGIPALRAAIGASWGARYGRDIDPEQEITVTSGATEAIFDVIQAFVEPGDEVIVFEPMYDSYMASVLIAHGTVVPVRLETPDWHIDPEALAAAISDRTKLIVLNTPHNPTGKVFSRGELQMIAGLAIEHDLIVVTDEVYDRLTFDGVEHVPIATFPGMWERTLTINSTGKTFSLTGWKVGYAIGPAHLQAGLRSVHQFVTFATSTPFQAAFAEAFPIAESSGYYDALSAAYESRRAVLRSGLEEAGFTVLPMAGSYFLMTTIAQDRFVTDVDLARWLITDIGVATVPPSAFYAQPDTAPFLIRFCFAKREETLREAGSRLARMGDLL
jgi:aspartate/methionine/tyrosine aminotransferase